MNIPHENTTSLFHVDLGKLRFLESDKIKSETKTALAKLASAKDDSGNPASIERLITKYSARSAKKEAYLGIYFSDPSNIKVDWVDFNKKFLGFVKKSTFNHCKNLARLKSRANKLELHLFDFLPCSFLKKYFPAFSSLNDSGFAEKMAKIVASLAEVKKITKKILQEAICDAIADVYTATPGKTKEEVAVAIIEKMPEEKRRAFLMAELAKLDCAPKEKAPFYITLPESEIALPRTVKLANPTDGYIYGINEDYGNGLMQLHIGFAPNVNPIADPMPPADTDGYIRTDNDAFNVISYPVEGDALFYRYSGSLGDSETKDTSDPQMEFGFDVEEEATTVNNEQFSDKPIVDALLSYIDIYVGSDATKVYSLTADGVCFIKEQPTLNLSDGDTLPLIECTKEGNNDNCISNGSLAYWNGTVFETLNPTAYGEAS